MELEYNARHKSERQIPYDFTHMQNLRNKTNEPRGKKKIEINQETDSMLEKKWLPERRWVWEWVKQGMEIKEYASR